ncbi:Rrf2 family transcriptional regulator [Bradyrhizobium sp. ISRA443]|uniref:Rrf2 family transcriptional regulator n=1 Tax=unclassified Bradyrhizobium TaxID=2631580 RepID=UPI002479B7C7|nr:MULTISPECIES: Rrf2 family transcriptional regulator [unclassified Bradyrhizobium]WGR95059.1 Rrf2 family transcriptional regulator [Bradyrhizobium sp. ISRA435]WGR99946.1 Rrf2 family transcriptional regulator [Bradyrhizobium sp. ISRA436]WGS06837.1 Rrf2 family transcriptional regulator [Bradyrhizobium sp. ISRA437]WGS13719.1 Rrf2 family transcriptional regulator [Bradyrhizobium sp. ISRA443]
MIRDSRLSSVLHGLLHMIGAAEPVTSDQLAQAMATNPVVVRRVMAGLREQSLVRSEKGHGGGWTMARDPSDITLADIYRAVGAPTIIAMGHRSEKPGCLVEQAVNDALGDTFREVEGIFLTRLGAVTLDALAKDFKRRLANHKQTLEDQVHAAR